MVSPNVFVDSVIFQLIGGELSVLLVKRPRDPYIGHWALPGGVNPVEITSDKAMEGLLLERAGIKKDKLELIEQLYTFDSLDRDPRGPAITLAYMGFSRNLIPKASKTTWHPQFFPVNDLPELAFDHSEIISYARERLSAKIEYTNAIFALLPRFFTLANLQEAYEAVLGKALDKRNFRKKFLSLDVIKPTNEYRRTGAHRPAQLYKFKAHQLEYLSRGFD